MRGGNQVFFGKVFYLDFSGSISYRYSSLTGWR